MPFGMEVGLGPGDFVLDGDPAPPEKKGYCLLWPRSPVSATAKLLFTNLQLSLRTKNISQSVRIWRGYTRDYVGVSVS